MRALLIVPFAVIVLGLAACGGSSDTKTATVTVPATTTTAVAPTTLTKQGYEALIEYTYLTNRDLSPAKFAARCERLGTGTGGFNEEVAAIREVCVTLADIQKASADVEKCTKKESDARARLRCVADGLDKIAAYSADAIDASKQVTQVNDMADGPCRSYLLDPKERARLRAFTGAARSTARTFRDDNASQEELQRAANQLDIAFTRFARTETSKSEELARARTCRPPS